MSEILTQMQVFLQECRDNARMKRRQSEVLLAEAAAIDRCADGIRNAIDVDAKRAADTGKP